MLKKWLFKEFEIKDLEAAKQILGMIIARDIIACTRKPFHEKYRNDVLEKSSRVDADAGSTSSYSHLRISNKQSLKKEEDNEQIDKVPYAFTFSSLVYDMVCTKPNIVYVVEVMSHFMSNSRKEPQPATKQLLCYLKGTTKVS